MLPLWHFVQENIIYYPYFPIGNFSFIFKIQQMHELEGGLVQVQTEGRKLMEAVVHHMVVR